MADDLPFAPTADTPTITRKMSQPVDEVPETFIKDGKVYSKNPTVPRQRAEFQVERIVQTFDTRPLFEALNEFVKTNDLEGFVKCWQNCTLDVKAVERHVYVTLRP